MMQIHENPRQIAWEEDRKGHANGLRVRSVHLFHELRQLRWPECSKCDVRSSWGSERRC